MAVHSLFGIVSLFRSNIIVPWQVFFYSPKRNAYCLLFYRARTTFAWLGGSRSDCIVLVGTVCIRPYGVYSKAFSGRNADACLMVFRLCANVWRCPTLGKCEVEWVASEENIFGADVLALAQWPRHAWIWYEVKIAGKGWMVAIFCSDVPLLQNLIVSTVFGIYCAIVRVRRSQIMRTGLRRPLLLLSEHLFRQPTAAAIFINFPLSISSSTPTSAAFHDHVFSRLRELGY